MTMTISRRDTIIIAVLMNTGLLALLFMTAMHFEDDAVIDSPEITIVAESQEPIPLVFENKSAHVSVSQVPTDEVDQALERYASGNATTLSTPSNITENIQAQTKAGASDTKYVEIVVKKGDFLEKIARANGTSVEEIKRINRLTNDNLVIGQVLKISVPAVKRENSVAKNQSTAASKNESIKSPGLDPIYYVVKSGDNPWKIARQFQVKYDDILLLNNLNEETARNLKPGDKIRIK